MWSARQTQSRDHRRRDLRSPWREEPQSLHGRQAHPRARHRSFQERRGHRILLRVWVRQEVNEALKNRVPKEGGAIEAEEDGRDSEGSRTRRRTGRAVPYTSFLCCRALSSVPATSMV